MPVFLVKSLPSSTSAFAGSQAAQQRVSDFSSALAAPDQASPATLTASAAANDVFCQSMPFPPLNADARQTRRGGRSSRPLGDAMRV